MNEVEMLHPQRYSWTTKGGLVVAHSSSFELFSPNGELIASIPGEIGGGVVVDTASVMYERSDLGGRRWEVDVTTGQCKPVRYIPRITPYGLSKDTVGFEGDIADQIAIGDSIVFEGDVVVRVVSIDVRRGGPAGISTVVTFVPLLPGQPFPSTKFKIVRRS